MTETNKLNAEELAATYLKMLAVKIDLLKIDDNFDTSRLDEQMDEILNGSDFTDTQTGKLLELSEMLHSGLGISNVLNRVWGHFTELQLTYLPDKTFNKLIDYVARQHFYGRVSCEFKHTLAGQYAYIDNWSEHKYQKRRQELVSLFNDIDLDFEAFFDYFFDEIDARPKDVTLAHILNSYVPESFRPFIEKSASLPYSASNLR